MRNCVINKDCLQAQLTYTLDSPRTRYILYYEKEFNLLTCKYGFVHYYKHRYYRRYRVHNIYSMNWHLERSGTVKWPIWRNAYHAANSFFTRVQ